MVWVAILEGKSDWSGGISPGNIEGLASSDAVEGWVGELGSVGNSKSCSSKDEA